MKKSLFALLACVCLFLMGCPLETESPIKGEATTIPAWLLGKWVQIKDGATGTKRYEVKSDPAGTARLVIVTLAQDQKDNPARPAVLSRVKGQFFLSVFEKGDEDDEPGYYHYAVTRIGSNELELVSLREQIVSFSASGEDISAFISSHPKTDYLNAEETERYRRED